MIKLEFKALLDAGVHFGHLTRKWNPKMAPFIFMKQNGIHIIDLNKTITCMQGAALQLNAMAQAGKKILFVATKKQIKASVEQTAKDLGMPYVTERWLGGTLTNFVNTRKLLKRMLSIEKNMQMAAYKSLAKKERLIIAREQEKLNRILQGLANVTRLPSALFVIDIKEEHIAVEEARKLGIPIFALVDTNTNPDMVDFPIPGNDDAFRSVDIVVRYLATAIKEGIASYKKEKAETAPKKEEEAVSNTATKGVPKRGIKVVQGVVIKKGLAAKGKVATPVAKVAAAAPPLKDQPEK
ncbi:ribosomal protein uS2 [Cardinium endosymbiont of Sogatella furcifera]|uniref:30S ribosomal protein S2 n=1 Tax=Cardinium endosymbiont of Sogatella furcifera TaxID=650378 RepID=UPI000E0DB323|nr:30S ribosomal protein S2 [Cardinium endosymbiont of Sogatella furcifera]AXI24457.1 ribosomal protein uS2 [Cardinium endosymbiont of Sogatella furcifera]